MCLNISKNDQSEAMQCHSTNVNGMVRFYNFIRSTHNCNRYHQQKPIFDEEPTTQVAQTQLPSENRHPELDIQCICWLSYSGDSVTPRLSIETESV